ncbi:hypothetical protein B9D02_22490 (plasmid) [Pantoea vagans]|nr:hypothetical protein B9D02_22490 [Pantoea vagans]
MAHFISGNLSSRRGYYGRTVGELFSVPGAVASLNSAFWQEALDLTDVYQYMPNDRRNEWNEQIREMVAPDFEEKTVRATLSELLFSREKFFAERIDGIFRNLSGEHVTNRPEGFGKRMIMARVYDEWGGNNYERTGYIDDLRQVIAKFMGCDATSYRTTDKILQIARKRAGEWLTLDGGALRVKAFLKGTAHLEIHPDMAWRLNDILAFLYPAAIPAEHRQQPRTKAKSFNLTSNLLPFSVLSELSELEIERTEPQQLNRWEEPREPVCTHLTSTSPLQNLPKHGLRAEKSASARRICARAGMSQAKTAKRSRPLQESTIKHETAAMEWTCCYSMKKMS